MIENVIGIFVSHARKLMLPIVVGHFSIGNMPLEMQPTIKNRQLPIVLKSKSDLRNGASVNA